MRLQVGATCYVSAPTTNSKCSLQTFHYPTVGYDIIQWKVNGF